MGASHEFQNECCGKTKRDKKVKILEHVILKIIFMLRDKKIASEKQFSRNQVKRPHTQFWYKTAIFEKTK
jgi:hypothetical protein